MSERFFGMETEYAFSGRNCHDGPMSAGPLVEQMERLGSRLFPSLPGFRSSGIFLQNASRLYRDPAGNYTHLEIAGPECANPWDVVRYLKAGELQLVQLAEELKRSNPAVNDAVFNRSNIDYSGACTTWGCHESYQTSRAIGGLSPDVVPHLVSRIIFSGAGGFNSRSPGIEFMISPRVAHITTVENTGSQYERPIFHTRDEPLCDGFHRLHVICGESLYSERAAWLKVATTAAIVALADAGINPGDSVRLASPVEAMRIFTNDPVCHSRVLLADGRTVTAIELQRHYLELVESHRNAGILPGWIHGLCREWTEVLDELERGAAGNARSLDWCIKLGLFREHAARRGFPWKTLPLWNDALRRLQQAGARPSPNEMKTCVAGTNIPKTPLVEELMAMAPGPGMSWEELPAFLQLRQELFEIDWRCGELGGRGLFAQLDRAGVLAHQMPGVDNIEHAMANPPSFGRARLRGEVIRRVVHVRDRFACDWKGIVDMENRVMLDLADPFACEEKWRPCLQGAISGPLADPMLARLMETLT